MSNKIRGVFGIIFSEDKKSMLMVKRRDIPIWVFPGGGIEVNETLEEACLRELKEETGLECEIVRKVCDYDHKKFHKVNAALFECKVIAGQPVVTNETLDISYFPLKNPPRVFVPIFKEFLDHTLEKSLVSPRTLKCMNFTNFIIFFLKHPLIFIRYFLTKFGLHYNSN